jgi:ribonuclease HI
MIEIYCDGAYSSSRDTGGWAFVVLDSGKKIFSDFYPAYKTTNNRMEIQAVIEACKWSIMHDISHITIYSDSMYVIGTVTMNWRRKKNEDLWSTLDGLSSKLFINWKHVKGHSGDTYNDLCDALASQATFVEAN